jgi:hypothetical protein
MAIIDEAARAAEWLRARKAKTYTHVVPCETEDTVDLACLLAEVRQEERNEHARVVAALAGERDDLRAELTAEQQRGAGYREMINRLEARLERYREALEKIDGEWDASPNVRRIASAVLTLPEAAGGQAPPKAGT